MLVYNNLSFDQDCSLLGTVSQVREVAPGPIVNETENNIYASSQTMANSECVSFVLCDERENG